MQGKGVYIGAIESAAGRAWGRVLTGYSFLAVHPSRFRLQGDPHPAVGAVIWAAWHGSNLIVVESYRRLNPERTLFLFVPPGLTGAIQCGRFVGMRVQTLALPHDGAGNPAAALKAMARGLAAGSDVAIAPDGPAGPARQVRPGTLWLARRTGRPIVLVGCAARPCLKWPRWDRHLVPLPGARIALVVEEPFYVDRDADLDALQAELADRLNAAERRAWEVLDE
jgi:lysophospholipid acyltransferase (LPLAT)-like uncharacterized protein